MRVVTNVLIGYTLKGKGCGLPHFSSFFHPADWNVDVTADQPEPDVGNTLRIAK